MVPTVQFLLLENLLPSPRLLGFWLKPSSPFQDPSEAALFPPGTPVAAKRGGPTFPGTRAQEARTG